MAFISDSWIIDLLVATLLIISALYYYLSSAFNYWRDRNVPSAKLGFKNSLQFYLKKKSNADLINEMYNQFPGEKLIGNYQFTYPTLLVRDPDLIERIMIKDFSHFEDRGLPMDTDREPLTANLVNMKGDEWRALRHKLTPTFTSGRLKGMFQQICNCGENLLHVIDKYAQSGETVDTKDICFLFTSDVIASCAFGLQIKPDTEEGNQFKAMVAKATGNASIYRLIFTMLLPKLARLIGLTIIPSDVTEYFTNITKATIEHRLKNNIHRDDFLQLLLALREQDDSGKSSGFGDDLIDQEDIQLKYTEKLTATKNDFKLTDDLIAAQSFVFLAAGSDSSSTTVSVTLHFIASDVEVHRRLQAEVDTVIESHGGVWSYQALKEMTYLDQVLQESMRIFPIAHVQLRTCTAAYRVPDTDLVIEKGLSVMIPTLSIHTDPTYYPEPEKFDPDRFFGNNFKPSPTFLPFGDGPRICIAMRFAVLEMKVMIAKIMSKYCVSSSPKTISPLRYDPSAFSNRPLGGIWVTFQKRVTKE